MMYWFIHILVLGFLSYVAFKHVKSPFSPLVFWSALTLKCSAGITVGLVFHYYYGLGDSLVFFEKAIEVSALSITDHSNQLLEDGSYATNNHPRDLFFIKILSVFSRLTGSSYWISSLYLSLISFLASWYFVITISRTFPEITKVAIVTFLFIPSVVFWSSGILKDTISSAVFIFPITILLKGVYLKRSSIQEVVLFLIALIVLFQIKHYLFITLILFAGLFFDLHLIRVFKKKVKWVIAFGVMVVALGSTQYVHPYLKWNKIPQTILEINETVYGNSSPTAQLDIKIEDPTWESIGLATPKALFTGLFRPSIFDSTISFGWIHRIENFLLVIVSAFSIILWIKLKPAIDFPLVIASLVCIFLLATMLSLTTPNFGSLVRYRNAFVPFLFLITSILPYQYISSKAKE